jgi:hypothetical protein
MLGEHRQGRVGRDPGKGRVQAAVVEHGRVQAADELAQLGQGLGGLVVGLLDHLADLLGRVGQAGPGHAEVHGQGDQPALGPVVQVALDPAPLGVGGGDDLGPAAGQRLHPQGQLLAAAGSEQGPGSRLIGLGHRPGHPWRSPDQRRGPQGRPQHGQAEAGGRP